MRQRGVEIGRHLQAGRKRMARQIAGVFADAAHLLQTSDIAFGFVSEVEVGAFMHFNRTQLCF